MYNVEPLTKARHASEINDQTVGELCRRVDDLAHANRANLEDRAKIRDLMDGGAAGISRLIGRDVTKDRTDLPVANQLQTASDRLAQKLGRRPDVKVDPPATQDSDRARKHADKRTRMLESWDRSAKMVLQLPQQARWVPGYGFGVWTLRQRRNSYGDPYPHASIRDPFNCYPGSFGLDQDPFDIAFAYTYTAEQLIRMYPEHAGKIKNYIGSAAPNGTHRTISASAAGQPGIGSWANQSGTGIDVYEYINADGTWWIAPALSLLLAYVPNPLASGPAFVFPKRFSFNKLKGQYDHIVGLMSAIARMNTLAVLAAEDAVFAETNIIGEMVSGTYQRGRHAVNHLRPGSQIAKQNDGIAFQVFQQIDRMEQQLRNGASYPITDDGRSPMSFVTGRGMESMAGALDLEVKEYQTVFGTALEELDWKRFEWVESLYPNRTLHIDGVSEGSPFSETYQPATHIAGHYASRRIYGIMAGFDEPNKLIGGMNLLQAKIIDRATYRESIDGLDNHTKIEERVRNEQIVDGLFAALGARATEGQDPLAISAMVKMLPDGEMKKLFDEVYVKPMEQQQAQMQEQAQMMESMGGIEGGGGAPPPVQTILNQMTTDRSPMMGVQGVGRL